MNFEKLDAFMKEMPSRGYPACELAITKDGETVYRTSVGYADAKKTRPASPSDLYWIFSTTKVITCIAAMRLVEEGKLSLSDPVSKYIPSFGDLTVKEKDGTVRPAKTTMTILHLFTMTGGLTYDLNTKHLLAARTADSSTLEIVSAMAKDPLAFDPGATYRYSLCHDVLAAVIEVITGKTFAAYLDELIFTPLGIRDMGFRPTEEQNSRFSALYVYQNGTGGVIERPVENPYILSSRFESGGAGLFSSVDEYMKIITTIACGGTTKDGYRLLKPETIRLMQENHLDNGAINVFSTSRLYGYGWGLCGRVHMNPARSLSLSPVGEFGWDGAANAFVVIDPENRIALFFGAHLHSCTYGYNVIHPILRNLAYDALKA